jgi:hypothetical protein
LVGATDRLRPIEPPSKDATPRPPRAGAQSLDQRFHLKKGVHGRGQQHQPHIRQHLQKINIPLADLLTSETSFHGIVPGKPIYRLGMINLDVIFGIPANFRKEKIKFEVVN